MRLRHPFPFRRVALVLAGGGAFGAYEVGVLRLLRAAGLRPTIVAGASVGAMNVLGWAAHDGDPEALERTWRRLRPSDVGIRWGMLGLRGLGSFLVAIGLLEMLFLLAGLPQLATLERLASQPQLGGYVRVTGALELLSWLLVAAAGVATIQLSGPLDDWLGHAFGVAESRRLQQSGGFGLIAGYALYLAAALLHWPWPLRFHFVVLVAATLGWLVHRPGRLRSWLGPLWLRLVPETRGRGLWRNAARRRVLRDLLRSGDANRLVTGDPLILLSACNLRTGRITFFANRHPDPPEFESVARAAAADVVIAHDARELAESAIASSAVPVLYVPVVIRRHEYIDGGLFANQPLAAVAGAGADAILLVLVSPSSGPRPVPPRSNLVEIAGRLSEIANWRDLEAELGRLPPGFSREGDPARVCVVEPEHPLDGGMFDFDPRRAGAFIARGEADARRALRRAGWIEDAPAHP